jgi:drug/metabolite transporter (DMT)-like permease
LDTLTTLFGSLGHYIPVYIAIFALAGIILAIRKNYIGGSLIAVGSIIHLVGYWVLTSRRVGDEITAFSDFLTSLMYPGTALTAAGLLYLAFTASPNHRRT